MNFYKDHYDVIIMGAGLAGLSCALQLQSRGIKDILILEKHNLPGGLATSYVRNGIEIEATLHEMMSIGTKEDRLKVGAFFDDMGVDIDWLPVPEAYRFLQTTDGIDITLHAGYRRMADEIDAQFPGWGDKVYEFMLLMRRVYDSMNILSVTPMSKPEMLLKHPDFVKTVGYSAEQVMSTFEFLLDLCRESDEYPSLYDLCIPDGGLLLRKLCRARPFPRDEHETREEGRGERGAD